ncbi:MAG: YlbF family regulator [Alicyclobacillus sp.]|nr:YlbF family regulator [Alicyclobacillus sp.]
MNHEHLLQKADAIAAMIGHSEVAQRFWQARRKMEHNRRAQELFERLKLVTNHQLGLAQVYPPDHPKVQELQAQIERLEEQLYGIPVAMQYKTAQAELNDLMQGVVHLLLSRLGQRLPVELGPRIGCGHGPDGQGCSCGENGA